MTAYRTREEWIATLPEAEREKEIRSHAAWLAKRARRRAERDAAKHYIYTLSSAAGVYVGCTSQPEQRCMQHFINGSGDPSWCSQVVHDAMRDGQPFLWRFRVVAVTSSYRAGREAEAALIDAFRMAGTAVFNGRRRQLPGETRDEARERRRAIILAARRARKVKRRLLCRAEQLQPNAQQGA